MVICTFHLNNSCRYGSQCKKEHIDIRLLVKTDIDAVIKGKQWPLSTYGPYKDKPSLDNFIVDQSFEEHRAAAYEAKTTGTLPTLAAQIAQSVADAKLRMQQLYELSGDSLNVLVALYNNHHGGDSSGPVVGQHQNNPFTKVNKPSLLGGTNPFGAKPALLQNPFSSAGPQPVAGGAASIFGASTSVQQQQQQQQPNPFASTSASSIFGAPAAPANPANIFGSAAAATTSAGASNNNSIFGAPVQTSFFGQPAVASSAATASNNIFGNAATTTSSVFGGAPTFGSSVPSSIFGGAQQPQNIFGQSAATTAAGASVFGGGTNATATAQPFGVAQPSVFGATAAVAAGTMPPQSQNIFATQQTATTVGAGADSIFGGGNNNLPFGSSNNNAFGAIAAGNNSNVFGVPAAAAAATATGSNNSNNVFGAVNLTSTSSSVFGATTNTTTSVPNPFQSNNNAAATGMSGFGVSAQQLQQKSSSNDPSMYTKLEDLSEQEVQAFHAPGFELGAIPVRPPPQSLITV